MGSSDPTAWNVSTDAGWEEIIMCCILSRFFFFFSGSDAHVVSFNAQNLTLAGNNAPGPNYTLWVSRVLPEDVTIEFVWKFTTADRRAYDQPRYAVNGVQQVRPLRSPLSNRL